MATETLSATSVVAKSGVQGTDVENITSLAADDTDYILASNNNTSVDLRVGFDSPKSDLNAGQTQTITVVASQFDEGQTGTPTITLEVWEAGGGAAIASTAAADVTAGDNTYTVDFTDADTADDTGASLELRVIGTKSGGSPSARNSVNIDFVKWVANYAVGFKPRWAKRSNRFINGGFS